MRFAVQLSVRFDWRGELHSNGQDLQLAWPNGCRLETYSTHNLTSPATWVLVTNVPVSSGAFLNVSVPVTNGPEFSGWKFHEILCAI
jgi:hypothetical protein